MFKKILIGLFSLFILLVVTAGLLIVFIPKDKILSEVISKINQSGDIELTIRGKTDLHLFPNIRIDIENATLKSKKNILASVDFDRLELSIGFMAAISGNYDIQKIIFTKPVATIDLSNKAQAALTKMMVATTAPLPQMPIDRQIAEDDTKLIEKIAIKKLQIINGDIRIIDRKNNLNEHFQNVNLEINLPSISRKMSAEGDFLYGGSKHKIDLSIDSLKDLLIDEDNADINLSFKNASGEIDFDGNIKMIGNEINYNGQTDIAISNLKAFLDTYKKFTGGGKDAPFTKIEYKGKTIGNDKKVNLKISKLMLDKLSTSGDLIINFSRKIPMIKGNLNFGTIDLAALKQDSPVTEAVAMLASTAAQIPQQQAAKASSNMDKKIDVSGIKKVNADLKIFVSQLILDNLQINSLTSHARINNGVLNATYNVPNIMQGSLEGDMMINANGTTPAFGLKMVGSNIESADLLNYVADRPYLSGPIQTRNNLNARGVTPKQMLRTLSGNGRASIAKGNINGIDLSESTQSITAILKSKEFNSAKKTPIQNTVIEYTISNGIMNVKKLQTNSNIASIYGAGKVNLVKETLNLYMKPKLNRKEKTLLDSILGSPFYIRGTFDNIIIVPDITALAPKLLKKGLKNTNPKDLLDKPGEILKNPKDLLKKPKDLFKLFK